MGGLNNQNRAWWVRLKDSFKGHYKGVLEEVKYSIGALMPRLGLGGVILCYNYKKEPPK